MEEKGPTARADRCWEELSFESLKADAVF